MITPFRQVSMVVSVSRREEAGSRAGIGFCMGNRTEKPRVILRIFVCQFCVPLFRIVLTML